MSVRRSTSFFMAITAAVLLSGAANAELVKYKIVDNAIPASLTGKAGDAEKGKKVFLNRKLGNCLACHSLSAVADQPFHGQIAPSLDGVASRYDVGQLRMQVVNAKVINPDTMMPAFYKADGFERVIKKFQGKSILSAEEVEDLIAYLMTQK